MVITKLPSSDQVRAAGDVTCNGCAAACCRLEVLVLSDTGVPEDLIEYDEWGSGSMARLEDGWCAALDRRSMRCSIYANRPLICREFAVASEDCLLEFSRRT